MTSVDADNIRMWQLGLGPMGRKLVVAAHERGYEIVGASDPAHAGRAIGELVDAPGLDDVEVEATGVGRDVDVVQVATVSDAAQVASQIRDALPRADAVVTTCERLAYPTGDDRSLADSLDDEARAADTGVLAAGINPGYAMDLFPVFGTGASSAIERIEVLRRADVSDRRAPLQHKVGAGMTPDAFERAAARNEIGHR
ncbi:MAG: dihydrodipicolinate reductase, partial [Bradymonadaceae bacterium]